MLGTRSAVFAPMRDLGLIVVVDDGHDQHEELRAPYPHARAVAVLRASHHNAALMLASHSRSVDAQALVERGWLATLNLSPTESRRVIAPVRAVGDVERERDPVAARLRIPSMAFEFLRQHLPQGPVLVQVPMTGHSATLACQRCGNRAVCHKCGGPMRARRRDVPECALCGFAPTRWSCKHCHTSQLRTPLPGAARTAEELARAFPGVLAVNSSARNIRDEIPDEPAIVVATPGAEPRPPSGYAGVMILDTEVTLEGSAIGTPRKQCDAGRTRLAWPVGLLTAVPSCWWVRRGTLPSRRCCAQTCLASPAGSLPSGPRPASPQR